MLNNFPCTPVWPLSEGLTWPSSPCGLPLKQLLWILFILSLFLLFFKNLLIWILFYSSVSSAERMTCLGKGHESLFSFLNFFWLFVCFWFTVPCIHFNQGIWAGLHQAWLLAQPLETVPVFHRSVNYRSKTSTVCRYSLTGCFITPKANIDRKSTNYLWIWQ